MSTADPAALGFLKPEKYAAVERERRWLCRGLPDLPVLRAEAIRDLYVEGTRLRLREARPVGGGERRPCGFRRRPTWRRTGG